MILNGQKMRAAARMDEARQRFRIDAITNRSEALFDRRFRLWHAVVSTPAADLLDVVAKVDLIQRAPPSEEEGHDAFASVASDVRRLAGERAAGVPGDLGGPHEHAVSLVPGR